LPRLYGKISVCRRENLKAEKKYVKSTCMDDVTKEELLREIESLRNRVRELESAEIERQEIERALRDSEKEYRAVVEIATELISRYLPDTTLTFVNEAYCKYHKKTKEELIGKSFLPFSPPDEQKRIKEKLATLSVDNVVVMHEGPIIDPSTGEERWQHWSNRAIFNDAGELIEIQSVGRDITERKKAEIALMHSEQHLRKKTEELENKNIALREIMEQIGFEKRQIMDDVIANIEEVILPVIQKMKACEVGDESKFIPLLERSLHDLASSFGRKIAEPMLKMTLREIEISNMIKTGFTTKEIASFLNVSPFTVESHRSNIRKKLKIENEKVNLATHLQNL